MSDLLISKFANMDRSVRRIWEVWLHITRFSHGLPK